MEFFRNALLAIFRKRNLGSLSPWLHEFARFRNFSRVTRQVFQIRQGPANSKPKIHSEKYSKTPKKILPSSPSYLEPLGLLENSSLGGQLGFVAPPLGP
jgi:hypothetical protein